MIWEDPEVVRLGDRQIHTKIQSTRIYKSLTSPGQDATASQLRVYKSGCLGEEEGIIFFLETDSLVEDFIYTKQSSTITKSLYSKYVLFWLYS